MNDPRAAWLSHLDHALQQRRESHLFREIRPITAAGPEIKINNKPYVQFCSNNYLGLANDPQVIAAAQKAAEQYGTGAGASRLVAGTSPLRAQLESRLAQLKKNERALLF